LRGHASAEQRGSDLSAIQTVAAKLPAARGYRLIVEKSTVPVQTARQIKRNSLSTVRSSSITKWLPIPNFCARLGAGDFFHPDRIVVAWNRGAEDQFREVYRPVLNRLSPARCMRIASPDQAAFLVTDTNSSKSSSTPQFISGMKISYINMSPTCVKRAGDVEKVAEGIGLDRRIGRLFCVRHRLWRILFSEDLQALSGLRKSGCDFSLLKEVEKVNLARIANSSTRYGRSVGLARQEAGPLGLAFKPNTTTSALLHRWR